MAPALEGIYRRVGIPWTEEPGRLQSMGSLGVRHDWATSLSLFTCMHWRRKWQPLQYSCLENPRDRGAWWAAAYGVAQSRTRLKRLSSSSSRNHKGWFYSRSNTARILASPSLINEDLELLLSGASSVLCIRLLAFVRSFHAQTCVMYRHLVETSTLERRPQTHKPR